MVRELQARLGQNASNSSIPPSANPPQAPPPLHKQPTGRKPGGQPGHTAHLRVRLPTERLTEPTVYYRPKTCADGEKGLAAVPILFTEWHLFRGGGSRQQLRFELEPLRQAVRDGLGEGTWCAEAKTATFCQNLLAVEAALWTFLSKEGVEPTNNPIERLLRSGVLWRKNAFGCPSESGCRFIERILRVTQTLRLQQRPVWEFLYHSLVAHRRGLPAPALLAEQ